ncbi:MAG: hypothetical protein ACPG77_19400, partial [Nannocystaceae bacterium]
DGDTSETMETASTQGMPSGTGTTVSETGTETETAGPTESMSESMGETAMTDSTGMPTIDPTTTETTSDETITDSETTQNPTETDTDTSPSESESETQTTDTDTDTETDTDTGDPDSCAKVDVVFAIDNSGSMSEEHSALQGPVFASFPEALLMVGNGIEDFHLGVIDACPKPAYFHNWGNEGACNFSTGENWMTSDSPNLDQEYACVTDFANNGYNDMADACLDSGDFGDDDEQPATTAAGSVSEAALQAANLNFLRDDALLFVVAMTDEDEEAIDENANDVDPVTIAQAIIAAKGSVDEVIFLGIGGASNCNGPYGSANDASKLQEITQVLVQKCEL